MSHQSRVAVIVGSLRRGSLNRKAALSLAQLAPDNLELRIVEIDDLPLYNEDLETANAPAPWARFRDEVRSSDAVLFVTPEYNRSVTGALKNAIDVGSRPYGASVFAGKPAAVMSVSQGNVGGFGANHHLRQSLVFLDMPVLQQPEAYIGSANALFDDEGNIADEITRSFFQSFVDSFADWIAQLRTGAMASRAA